jgi:hypothetical protein
MKRIDFVGNIVQALGEMGVLHPDGYGYEELADHLANKIEELGIKPPCLDGDKCQFLMHKYMDPSFYYWDEDFEKSLGEEYREWSARRKEAMDRRKNRR